MTSLSEKTTVAIIGAGVSGLTVAALLEKCGIPCIVLEKRDLSQIQQRQRAGSARTAMPACSRSGGCPTC